MEKKLTAKRGDHAGGWYADYGRRKYINLNHSDWCLFDEEGNLAIDKEGRPYCWTTKTVAQWNADNYTDWVAGFATRVDCPIKFSGHAV